VGGNGHPLKIELANKGKKTNHVCGFQKKRLKGGGGTVNASGKSPGGRTKKKTATKGTKKTAKGKKASIRKVVGFLGGGGLEARL